MSEFRNICQIVNENDVGSDPLVGNSPQLRANVVESG